MQQHLTRPNHIRTKPSNMIYFSLYHIHDAITMLFQSLERKIDCKNGSFLSLLRSGSVRLSNAQGQPTDVVGIGFGNRIKRRKLVFSAFSLRTLFPILFHLNSYCKIFNSFILSLIYLSPAPCSVLMGCSMICNILQPS